MINLLVRNRRPAAEADPATPRRRLPRPAVWGLAGWAALIAVAFVAGAELRDAGLMPWDPLAPLHARLRYPSLSMWPAVALAAVAVVALPGLAGRLPWRSLLAVTWLGALAWAVVLATTDGGWSALERPLTTRTEYLVGLPAMGNDPMGWLRTFTEALPAYPTHVKGHPPLPMLILWTMRWIGLGGAGWAAALVIGVGTSAAVAVAVTVRALAGEDAARRAIPFLVLTPAAMWVATSMDALFLGVSAWGVALVALATAPGRRNSFHSLWTTVAGVAGGVLGTLPYLSYGLVPIFALPLAILLFTRPPRRVLVALIAGCAVVPVAFTLAGFYWWDGVVATHAAWSAAPGSHDRPYFYFVVGDLATLALVTGPATARALSGLPHLRLSRPSLTRSSLSRLSPFSPRLFRSRLFRSRLPRLGLRGRPATRSAETGALAMLTGAALVGALALDLAGITRGEVERIWLPYAAWVMTATALLGPRSAGPDRAGETAGASWRSAPRRWLLAQALVALLLQAVVRSPW